MARAPITTGLLLLVLGCAPAVAPGTSVSVGKSNDGWLLRGVPMPDRGIGYVRARPGEETRYGIPRLVQVIERAAASVDAAFPGTPPLRVGDLSYPRGGRHPRHGSHRSGRDVDLIYYATTPTGRPVQGRGWVAYDRFGMGREPDEHGGAHMALDVARNWHLVRTLLADEDAQVQWIFCSAGVKARLLEHAIANEPSRAIVFRAAWVLHQPRRAHPHDDHFHIRIGCGAEQRALGCQDRGPIWPWWTDEAIKNETNEALDDAALVHALLDPVDPAVASAPAGGS
ncbi:MAG: penicillin-insensitive murein endopeptidase [Deltaproteobacteria bacterium]|nr:penicillin-insensitive murein endopeptidase [Deltaproteobacteria bacterium]